jgi:type II secretory pathway component PulF
MTTPRFDSPGNSQAVALASEITQATQTGAPLSEALLAAADGAHDRRTRWALRQLAERVARGEPLAQILENDSPLPAHLSGLLRASLATGQPSLAIAEWLFARERAHAHWKSVLAALTYPLVTLASAYGLFVFLSIFLMVDLSKMLDEFGIKLPEHVRAIYLFTQYGAPLSLYLFGGVAAILLLVRVIGGRSVWSQFMTALPLLGPLWHWSGSSELYRVLAILLDL